MSIEVKGSLFKRKTLGGKELYLKPDNPTPGHWWVSYMVDRKRNQQSLNTMDEATAKQRWADLRADLVTMDDELRHAQRILQRYEQAKAKVEQLEHGGCILKMSDAWEQFLKSKRRRVGTKDRTLVSYEQQFNRFAKWAPGTIRTIRDLTPVLAERYVDDLDNDAKMSAGTVNKHIKALQLIWSTVDHTWKNPWRGLHSSRKSVVEHYRRLSLPECRAVYRASKGHWRSLILLAFCTGQRRADCCLLKWSQVDMKAKVITFVPVKTDQRKAPSVKTPMSAQLFKELSGIERDGEYVLPGIAKLYHADSSMISKYFKGLLTDNKIIDTKDGVASFHSLRKTFASMLGDAGAPQGVVSYLTSHSLGGVNDTYNEPSAKTLKDWIDRAIPAL